MITGIEFLVETTPGSWAALDTFGEAPPMVFQINDLNELADRQASYSQSIDFPKTPNNNRIFEHAEVFEAHSPVPYTIHRVTVYVDGIEIVNSSFRLELRSVTNDVYKCQIVSNTKGLFAVLAETSFSDLPLSPFVWGLDDTAVNYPGSPELRKWLQTANKYFTYLTDNLEWLVNGSQRQFFKVGGERGDNADAAQEFEWFAALRPYYPILEIAKMIFERQGYTLETNIEALPGYKKHYFSLCNMVPQEDSFDALQAYAIGLAQSYAGVPEAPLPIFDILSSISSAYAGIDTLSFLNPYVEDEPLLPTIYPVRYSSPGCYTLKVRIKPIYSGAHGPARFRFRVVKYARYFDKDQSYGTEFDILGETETEGIRASEIPVDGWETDKFELAVGEDVHVEAYLMEGYGATAFNCRVEYVHDYLDNSQCGPGCKVYPALSTDFKNQSDFIKLFIQLYGLFLTIDEEAKIVRAMTFQTLLDRVSRGAVVDWTAKMDVASPRTTSFQVGSYAQANRILAQEHAQMVGAIDFGLIKINNSTLEATKDLVTLAVQSSFEVKSTFENYKTLLREVALECGCGLLNTDGRAYQIYGGMNGQHWIHYIYKPASLKTHIVAFETYVDQSGDILAQYAYRYARNTTNLSVWARFGRAVKLQDIVDTYYKPLQDYILNPVRAIEAKFKLSTVDIQKLDLLTPVYLDQFGDFFYIQKVNNYIAGELTTVNLICLNTVK